jgi:hypothetical protein
MQHGGKPEMERDERRKHPRSHANIVVSYHIAKEEANYDVSQSLNISKGGMMLTTNRAFDMGTRLALTLQLPFMDHKIEVIGEVVESKQVLKDLIYQTHLKFYDTKGEWSAELANYLKKRK